MPLNDSILLRARRIALAALLVTASALTFWPGLHGWFVFDDHVNLVTSDQWKVTSLHWREWRRAIFSDISGAIGRPLAMGSFAVNHYLSGLDPFWLKAGNLALHLLNGLLLWRLLNHILRLLPINDGPGHHAAWLVALAWSVHPLHMSTVMYIVQRMEIGAATGILLAQLAYVLGRSRQLEGRIAWPWLAATPLAVLLGLGFKESALLAPVFALLIELTIFRFQANARKTSKALKIAWSGIIIVALAAYLYVIVPQIQSWPHDIRNFGPADRVRTQAPVLVMYIQQILLPLPESMRFYYDNFPISQSLMQPRWTAISVGILVAIATIATITTKRFPLVTLGISWFFVGHALTSNLWPLELAFEHRNYLASAGLVLALVQPTDYMLSRLSTEARTTILGLLMLALAALCFLQARTWGDPMTLAWTLENRNPDSPRANYDLASRLLIAADDNPDSPFWSMATSQFEHALDSTDPSPLVLQGLLLMHGRAGIQPPKHYWDMLRESLAAKALHGERAGALHALTVCQIEHRCSFDSSQMLDTFIVVMRRNPNNPVAHTLYANFAWNVMHDQALAIDLQREAVRLDDSSPAFRLALAKFLLASGDETNGVEGRILLRLLHAENSTGQLDKDLAELEMLAASVISGDTVVQ